MVLTHEKKINLKMTDINCYLNWRNQLLIIIYIHINHWISLLNLLKREEGLSSTSLHIGRLKFPALLSSFRGKKWFFLPNPYQVFFRSFCLSGFFSLRAWTKEIPLEIQVIASSSEKPRKRHFTTFMGRIVIFSIMWIHFKKGFYFIGISLIA